MSTWSAQQIEAGRNLLAHYNYSGGWEPGSFTASLIRCLERADAQKTAKLLSVFPEFEEPIIYLREYGAGTLKSRIEKDSGQ